MIAELSSNTSVIEALPDGKEDNSSEQLISDLEEVRRLKSRIESILEQFPEPTAPIPAKNITISFLAEISNQTEGVSQAVQVTDVIATISATPMTIDTEHCLHNEDLPLLAVRSTPRSPGRLLTIYPELSQSSSSSYSLSLNMDTDYGMEAVSDDEESDFYEISAESESPTFSDASTDKMGINAEFQESNALDTEIIAETDVKEPVSVECADSDISSFISSQMNNAMTLAIGNIISRVRFDQDETTRHFQSIINDKDELIQSKDELIASSAIRHACEMRAITDKMNADSYSHETSLAHIAGRHYSNALERNNRDLLHRYLHSWRRQAHESLSEQRLERLSVDYRREHIKRQVIRHWRQEASRVIRKRQEAEQKQELDDVVRDVVGQYESRLTEMQAQMDALELEADMERKKRIQTEEDVKRIFMKGVTALNLEAMKYMQFMPPNHGDAMMAQDDNISSPMVSVSESDDGSHDDDESEEAEARPIPISITAKPCAHVKVTSRIKTVRKVDTKPKVPQSRPKDEKFYYGASYGAVSKSASRATIKKT